MTRTAIGTVSSTRPVDVDGHGGVHPLDGAWSLDWWVGADDRWHVPAEEPTLRQQLVDAAPVVRSAVRVPGGDAVVHAYGVSGGGDPVVLDVVNESPAPFVAAFVVSGAAAVGSQSATVLVDGRPALRSLRPPAAWAISADGDVRERVVGGSAESGPLPARTDADCGLDAALLYPVAHRARLRLVVGDAPDLDLDAVPGPDAAARGWHALLRRGTRVELPDPGLAADLAAAQAAAVLAVRRTPADAAVVAALEEWGFDDEAAAGWDRLGWRARRAASARPARAPSWGDVLAARAAGPAELLLAARGLLVHEQPDEITLLAELPPGWAGHGVDVHDAPTRRGPVSFAVRWHGPRPALLWDAPDGVRLRAPGLDPRWSSAEGRGDALLAGRVA